MTTLIVTASPAGGQEEARNRYLHAVLPLLIRAGGKPVKRLAVTEIVTGSPGVGIVLVMDFADANTLRSVFDSEDYVALVGDRDQGFSNIEILVTEDLPNPTPR
jgi:uncharacterized protein (DUF1330 family)